MLFFFSLERFLLSSIISNSFDDRHEVLSFFRVIIPDPDSSVGLVGMYLLTY